MARLMASSLYLGAALFLSVATPAQDRQPTGTGPDRYDVVWDSPSTDYNGSVPLGNGDIGLNAWFEPSGQLVFYISKTDAWGDNGRLLKVGRVRVTLDPPPRVKPYLQTLRLRDATLEVVCGKPDAPTTVRLWVDANRPVVHVTVDSASPITATASIELWRNKREELPTIEVSDVLLDRSKPNQQRAPTVVEPDTVLRNETDRIGWYHHNAKSVGPKLTAEVQGLTGYLRDDPLLHRTFGAVITAQNGRRVDDLNLQSPRSTAHRFSAYVLTKHPATPRSWLEAVDRVMAWTGKVAAEKRRSEHEEWWRGFWRRAEPEAARSHGG